MERHRAVQKFSKPLVSVIITTRNRKELLITALESVLAQTYRPLDIIIVDDRSSDGTNKRVSMYMQDHPECKFRYFRNEKKGGANIVRNIGANMAKGHYLAYLDDDDIWVSTKLEKQVDAIENDNQIALVTCYRYKKDKIETVPTDISEDVILYNNVAGSFSFCLFRKSDLVAVGGHDEGLQNAQDWDLWLKLSRKGLIVAVPEPLVKYAYMAGNRISEKRPYQRYATYMQVVESNKTRMSLWTYQLHKSLVLYHQTPRSRRIVRLIRGLVYFFWIVAGRIVIGNQIKLINTPEEQQAHKP